MYASSALPSLADFAGWGGSWCPVQGLLLRCAETHFTKRKVSVGRRACRGGGFVAEVPAPCCAPSPCLVPWCRSHLLSVAARGGRTRQAANLSP